MKLHGVKVGDTLIVTHNVRHAPVIERYVVTSLSPTGKVVKARRTSLESRFDKLSFTVASGSCVSYWGFSARRENV